MPNHEKQKAFFDLRSFIEFEIVPMGISMQKVSNEDIYSFNFKIKYKQFPGQAVVHKSNPGDTPKTPKTLKTSKRVNIGPNIRPRTPNNRPNIPNRPNNRNR